MNGLLVAPDSVPGHGRCPAPPGHRRPTSGAGSARVPMQSTRRYAPDVLARAAGSEIFESALEPSRLRRRRAAAPAPSRRHSTTAQPGAEPTEAPAETTPAMARQRGPRLGGPHCAAASATPGSSSRPTTRRRRRWSCRCRRGTRSSASSAGATGRRTSPCVDAGGYGWPERRGTTVASSPATSAEAVRPASASNPGRRAGEKPSLLAQGCRVDVEFWEVGRQRRPGGPDAPTPTPSRLPAGTATVDVEIEGVAVPDPSADEGTDRARVPVPDRRRLHLGGRRATPPGTRPASSGWPAVTGTARPQESSGRARFTARDELRYSMRSTPPLRALGAPDPPGHRRSGPRLAGPGAPPDPRRRPPRDPPGGRAPDVQLPCHRDRPAPRPRPHRALDLRQRRLLPRPPGDGRSPSSRPAASRRCSCRTTASGCRDPAAPPWLKAAWNNRRLLQQAFGVALTASLAHSPHPHRLSVLQEHRATVRRGGRPHRSLAVPLGHRPVAAVARSPSTTGC